MASEFDAIFVRLRSIFEHHATPQAIRHEKPGYYWLEPRPAGKKEKSFWIGGVQIGKNYVSFHLMPVYMFPKLLEGASEKLRARKQGKACFNFKTIDELLFAELEALTSRGFAAAKNTVFPKR